MVFGGERITYDTRFNNENATEYVSVNGYADFHKVFFSLFRITLVDEYDYEVRVLTPNYYIYRLKWKNDNVDLYPTNLVGF